MSEKPSVGVLGQLYEDRLTGKRGLLIDRNEEHCSLTFEGPDKNKFIVSNATFKSKWRKCVSEEIIVPEFESAPKKAEKKPVEAMKKTEKPETEKPKKAEKPKKEKSEATKPVKEDVVLGNLDFEEVVPEFKTAVLKNHDTVDVYRKDDYLEAIIDGVLTFTCYKRDNVLEFKMLPDLYTYSNLNGVLIQSSLEFRVGEKDVNGKIDHLTVRFSTKCMTFGDVLTIIKDAATDLNLYGYIEEEE